MSTNTYTASGCDSCSTFDAPSIGMGQYNGVFDSQMNTSMSNPYTCQNTNMVNQQMQSFQASASYPQGGNITNHNKQTQSQQIQSRQNNNKVIVQATQAAHAAATAAATAAAAIASTVASTATTQSPQQIPEDYLPINNSQSSYGLVEGFEHQHSLKDKMVMWIVLFMITVSSLGLNEFIKFMINKNIQTENGSPYYYLLYCGFVLLGGLLIVKYTYDK